MQNIQAINKGKSSINVYIDHYPDTCPVCHTAIDPIPLNAYLSGESRPYDSLNIVCRCPRIKCDRIFLAVYNWISRRGDVDAMAYSHACPISYKTTILHDTIGKISPAFITIYAQAEHAETLGLKEICGAGYRKALEFLVKDFIISPASKIDTKAGEVKKTFLGVCIEKYIDDNKIKKFAKLATWLGNDETHYYRKWEDKDLADLKRLIHLTINAIDNELVGDEYMKSMKEVTT